ncbi:MAG: ribbon-helix-helix protein, CopG family [Pyrobaculum sp.]
MPKKRNNENMPSISIHIPYAILDLIDRMVELGYYANRSDAIRELLRVQLLYMLNHGEICRKLAEQLEAKQKQKQGATKTVEEQIREQEEKELDAKLIPGRV